MSYDTFTVSAEVSMRDIKDSIDFDDIVSSYEPDADDLLKHVDFEDALKFVIEDPEFSSVETCDALLENDELRERMIEHMPKATPPEVETLDGGKLFHSVKVGKLTAVITGDKVRFKHADHDEVHEFTCSDSGMALNLLQGLAMVQS